MVTSGWSEDIAVLIQSSKTDGFFILKRISEKWIARVVLGRFSFKKDNANTVQFGRKLNISEHY